MNLPVSPIRKECEKVIALNVDPLVADEYSKNVVSIALGTVWFCFQANYTVSAALAVCVIPFIPADLIKMVLAMSIGPEIRKRLGSVVQ